jgi:hypothetical protein
VTFLVVGFRCWFEQEILGLDITVYKVSLTKKLECPC